jgi:hypothetical protein
MNRLREFEFDSGKNIFLEFYLFYGWILDYWGFFPLKIIGLIKKMFEFVCYCILQGW